MIKLNNVTFSYPGQEKAVLKAIDLSIAEHGFVAIMGLNGSGKSSLARLMNGLLLPAEGSVTVDGLDTRDRASNLAVKRKVGLVMSVPDNQIVAGAVEDDVAFGPENLGLPSFEIRRRVDRALAWVGMSAYRRADPFSLSGGQKQRVCIAGMLAMEPDYMIFDEPVTMLDAKEQLEIIALLKRLYAEKRRAVILITHNLQEAAMADRLVVLHQGAVALDGATRSVAARHDDLSRLGIEPLEATSVIHELARAGFSGLKPALSPDEAVEEICRLTSAR
jgi:energy-coupling factor transport system ATP-binding protein